RPPQTYDPPPGTMVCQPPYYQSVAGSCALVCGEGTRGMAGMTESTATPCACQPGLVPQGEDEQGRLICGIASVQPPSAGRRSCGPNSTFDDATGECTCIEGTAETARDALGRPTCLARRIGPVPPVTATPVTPMPQAYEIDGLVVAGYANARGWRTVAERIVNAA